MVGGYDGWTWWVDMVGGYGGWTWIVNMVGGHGVCTDGATRMNCIVVSP